MVRKITTKVNFNKLLKITTICKNIKLYIVNRVIDRLSTVNDLMELNLSGMSGVKFTKGSKLKNLDLSSSSLRIFDDKMIELPPGLESLDLFGNNLKSIDDLTIPQTVTSLDLGFNNLRTLKVKSHIEILNLNENPIHLNFSVPKDLELRVLDLMGIGLREFSFDLIEAWKLTQIRLGNELEEVDVSNMPANFQVLECNGYHIVDGLYRYPSRIIYRAFH